MTIKLIVGLANPGIKFSKTRHNIGSWYIDLLSKHFLSPLRKDSKFYGLTSYINLVNTHLLIPKTFINTSGTVILNMMKFYCIYPDEILVAYDELDLPPGIAKFKFGINHIGHKGVKNIVESLGNKSNFYNLRIGIGHPGKKEKVVNFVLSNPSIKEKKLIDSVIIKAVYCTEIMLKEGLDKATNCLNGFKANKYLY